MNVVIIPARGGSVRIPGKNMRDFSGKPIIAWSIEVAKLAACFDSIVVSTDDEAIAKIAKDYGAAVPFARPSALADDYTGTLPVVSHAIRELQKSSPEINNVCCLYPTAPFTTAADIRQGLEILTHARCDYVFPITTYAHPIQRALRLGAEGRLSMLSSQHAKSRSQDLDTAYHDAGQFYWGRAGTWLQGHPILSDRSRSLVIPRHRAVDIDTEEDWVQAEQLFKLQRQLAAP